MCLKNYLGSRNFKKYLIQLTSVFSKAKSFLNGFGGLRARAPKGLTLVSTTLSEILNDTNVPGIKG